MPERPSFEVLEPAGPASPIVVHVPHAATIIPDGVRGGLSVDDDALADELLLLTDHRTDVLAAGAAAHGATRFVNRLSRLVVDPERLPDDREELAARGMGAVYTRGHRQQQLRDPTGADVERLLARYHRPYAQAFSRLVATRVASHGTCTIIDVHSYPSQRLPYELHDGPRPQVCIGTDPVHTPRWLSGIVGTVTARSGFETALDTPFTGTYVPLDRFGSDTRVSSVMLEIRRDLYLDEGTATPHAGERRVANLVEDVVAAVTAHHRG